MITLPDWQRRAACAGKARLMTPTPGDRESAARALSVCARCPVLAECREWALTLPSDEDPEGMVLGGLIWEQRLTSARRVCTACKRELPVTSFGIQWRRDRGRACIRSWCWDCHTARTRARYYQRKRAASLAA